MKLKIIDYSGYRCLQQRFIDKMMKCFTNATSAYNPYVLRIQNITDLIVFLNGQHILVYTELMEQFITHVVHIFAGNNFKTVIRLFIVRNIFIGRLIGDHSQRTSSLIGRRVGWIKRDSHLML